jgi:hypothetical protein
LIEEALVVSQVVRVDFEEIAYEREAFGSWDFSDCFAVY